MDTLTRTNKNLWANNMIGGLTPYKRNFPLNGLALYLPLWHPELTGSTIISKDLNAHSCVVAGAIWGVDGRTFETADEIETADLGLTDADDYSICEYFEGHFRVLVNEGGVGKTYYIDGADITPATFTPTYSLSTNKILGAVE